MNEIDPEFNALTQEIDSYLDKDVPKSRKRKFGAGSNMVVDDLEMSETDEFIRASTINVIKKCLTSDKDEGKYEPEVEDEEQIDNPDTELNLMSLGLKPDIAAMCLPEPVNTNVSCLLGMILLNI